MARVIDCACGHQLMAADEPTLFRAAREHAGQAHPDLNLTDEQVWQVVREQGYDPGGRNVALIRRTFEEVWTRGNLELADELYARDFVNHDPMNPEVPPGPDGVRRLVTLYREAFPDTQFTVHETIASGDRVVSRWTVQGTHTGPLYNLAPTGRRATVAGISVHRVESGKIAEAWVSWDGLGLMQQLGLVPTMVRAI